MEKRNYAMPILSMVGVAFSLLSCAKDNPSLKNCSFTIDEKFLSANLAIPIDDFNDLGFALGDSCSIAFSNGYSLEDVPYYNGYYVKNGEPVIVAYPSSGFISITLNNIGIAEAGNLSEKDTVSVSLKEKGKYLVTQEALGQSYSLLREDYSSDEEFANFRALTGGKIKEGALYRGASPFDNSRSRASTVDALLKRESVSTIVDLADSSSDMESYLSNPSFSSPYAKSLYESNDVILLSMGSGYATDAYKKKVADGCRFMIGKEAPYYIHCMEGKDRTGFVCTLLEALSGASYQEMRFDYMLTYQNYYKITSEKTPEKYNAVVSLYFDSFMECLTDAVADKKKTSYVDEAAKYLKEGGLSEEEINELRAKIADID